MALVAAEPLERGLIAALAPPHGPAAFDVLRGWQERNHIGDRLGEYTGAGSQWSEYAVTQLPFMWALVAALMEQVPGARAWCAQQPGALMRAVRRSDYPEVVVLPGWVMHLAAGVPGCEELYEEARERVADVGGLTAGWMLTPVPATPTDEAFVPYETIVAVEEDGLAPAAAELRTLVRSTVGAPRSAVALALDALLVDAVERDDDGAAVTRLLATERRAAAVA